jgi:hypothetical protein
MLRSVAAMSASRMKVNQLQHWDRKKAEMKKATMVGKSDPAAARSSGWPT